MGETPSLTSPREFIYSHTDKPDKRRGSKQTAQQSLKPLSENTRGGWGGSRRDSQSHRRGHWRDPQGPRTYMKPPTQESAPQWPNLIVGSREVTEIWQSGASTIAPSRPLPHVQHHSTATNVTPPWGTPKAPPLKVTEAPRQKKKDPNRLQKKYN